MIRYSLHPKQVILYVFFFLALAGHAQTSNDSLILLANQKLYKINKNNGGVSSYLDIINAPNFDPFSLDWSESQNSYFGIEVTLGNSIFKISESGVYTSLGPVNVPGYTISVMEGIAFNPQDNYLYISGSINGGSSQGDYCSETLIKVNLTNMQGQVIGTFSHSLTNALEPEADAIEFDEQGALYYFDCSVNSDSRIFKQDLNFANPPVLLCQAPYYSMADLTVKDSEIFIARGSGSYIVNKCPVNGGSLQTVNLSPNSLFNGTNLRGITWKPSCDQAPVASFSALGATTGYPGLTVSFSNSSQNATSFQFQFGTFLTTNTNDVNEIVAVTFNQPGVYPIILTATNGSCSDTSIVYVTILQPNNEPEPNEPVSTVLPTAFSPDGDGINDDFFLTFPNAISIHLTIFNRWGNRIIELDGMNKKWDGKINDEPASEGVYFYTFEVNMANHQQLSGHGYLTLIR